MAEGSCEKDEGNIMNKDSDVDDVVVLDIIGENEYNILFAFDDDIWEILTFRDLT